MMSGFMNGSPPVKPISMRPERQRLVEKAVAPPSSREIDQRVVARRAFDIAARAGRDCTGAGVEPERLEPAQRDSGARLPPSPCGRDRGTCPVERSRRIEDRRTVTGGSAPQLLQPLVATAIPAVDIYIGPGSSCNNPGDSPRPARNGPAGSSVTAIGCPIRAWSICASAWRQPAAAWPDCATKMAGR